MIIAELKRHLGTVMKHYEPDFENIGRDVTGCFSIRPCAQACLAPHKRPIRCGRCRT